MKHTKINDHNNICHKKIKIGFIFNHSYFLGGGEISFYELIKNMNKEYFKPVVIVPASGKIKKKLRNENIEVHSIAFPSLRSIMKLSPLKSIFNLVYFLKENKIDLIHVNGSRVCFYGAIAGRINKTPVIWHVRESLKDLFLYDWLLATLTNVIVCVSKSVRFKRFGRFGQKVSKKIYVVYNGIDISRFTKCPKKRDQVRTQLSLKPSDVLIGLIGNIIPRKAQDFFLKGLAKAKQIEPEIQIKVILIGHDLNKQYSDYLQKLVTDLDLDSNVIFRKFSKEIESYFSALDIYVLSSKSEGFCRSLLEAMSCSLPIIATKISEIEEAVDHEKNGILVDFMDIPKMASSIIMLYKDMKLRRKLGCRNRSVIKKKYSIVSHTKKIEHLYLTII